MTSSECVVGNEDELEEQRAVAVVVIDGSQKGGGSWIRER
jgi:hypothetical protein